MENIAVKKKLFTASNAVSPMDLFIFAGIKVVIEGGTFALAVKMVLLPHFSLWILLSAELAALRTVNNLSISGHVTRDS